MIAKQYCYAFLLLLFIFFNQNADTHFSPGSFFTIKEQYENINLTTESDTERELIQKQKALEKQKLKKKYSAVADASDENKDFYSLVFSQAPKVLKTLIEDMKNKESYALRYKYFLLSGPPGVGKTTLAQAIAFALGRKPLIISGPSLLGHYRDQAAEHIRDLFDQLHNEEEMPVLIIDEVNALTDGHTSEHADTKHTAMQLWTLLDAFSCYKDFLFIGTTNITKKMPHQLQSRFEGKTFHIDIPGFDVRRQILNNCLNKFKIIKDETCTDEYLNELAKKTENFTQRRLEILIDTALLLFSSDNPHVYPKKVSKIYLDRACEQLIEQKDKYWDFAEQMTDEERRHKESLDQQKRLHEDNTETQLKSLEASLLFQALMASITGGERTPFMKDTMEKFESVNSIIFPERKKKAEIYDEQRGLFSDYKIRAVREQMKSR